jgi:hypothetical protein
MLMINGRSLDLDVSREDLARTLRRIADQLEEPTTKIDESGSVLVCNDATMEETRDWYRLDAQLPWHVEWAPNGIPRRDSHAFPAVGEEASS